MSTKASKRVAVAVKEREDVKQEVELHYLELSTILKETEKAHWRIAELMDKLAQAGQTQVAISDRLTRMGTPLDQSQVSRYLMVYNYYVRVLAMENEAKRLTFTTLLHIAKVFKRSNAPYSRIKTVFAEIAKQQMSTYQAVEYAMKELDVDDGADRFKTIRIPGPVFDAFERARMRVSRHMVARGEGELTVPQAIEFMAEVVDQMSDKVLKELEDAFFGKGA